MSKQNENLLTSKELSQMFGISVATLYRILKEGPAKGKNRGHSVDLGMLPDLRVGGKRFWHRQPAEDLLKGD